MILQTTIITNYLELTDNLKSLIIDNIQSKFEVNSINFVKRPLSYTQGIIIQIDNLTSNNILNRIIDGLNGEHYCYVTNKTFKWKCDNFIHDVEYMI